MSASRKSIGDRCGNRSLYVVERRYSCNGEWGLMADYTTGHSTYAWPTRKQAFAAREHIYQEYRDERFEGFSRADYRVRLYARVEDTP